LKKTAYSIKNAIFMYFFVDILKLVCYIKWARREKPCKSNNILK